MKEILKNLPERPNKPRNEGLTMVMDKGLSLNEAENMVALKSDLTDIVKLGFGTSILTKNIAEKIKLYQESGMMVYTGGTLFEAFIVRNQFDDYCKLMDTLKLDMVEVSDGSMFIEHDKKCEYIQKLASNYRVISEIGSKDESVTIKNSDWIKFMKKELDAGSWKVIAEAREGGNVGVFYKNGLVKNDLIQEITKQISVTEILWEAPQKQQQVWFINNFGANVNLGNISPNDIISLECLRLGLRGDTFNNYL
ncbi:MAG: phosphosulfolactate synthase [Flavobacteriales bacterium]|jgi:phosphosulfolactate synthase